MITRQAFEEFAANATRSIAMRNANMNSAKVAEVID
jgi:ATP-binding protein involved in chromosome partitioning